MFDLTVSVILALGLGAMLVLWTGVTIRYSRRTKMLRTIGLAVSSIMMACLVAGAQLLRIFMDGTSRQVSQIIAISAFIVGDIALWYIWKGGGIDAMEREMMADFKNRLDRHAVRIGEMEKSLSLAPGTSPDHPMHIEMHEVRNSKAPTGAADDPIHVETIDARQDSGRRTP